MKPFRNTSKKALFPDMILSMFSTFYGDPGTCLSFLKMKTDKIYLPHVSTDDALNVFDCSVNLQFLHLRLTSSIIK